MEKTKTVSKQQQQQKSEQKKIKPRFLRISDPRDVAEFRKKKSEQRRASRRASDSKVDKPNKCTQTKETDISEVTQTFNAIKLSTLENVAKDANIINDDDVFSSETIEKTETNVSVRKTGSVTRSRSIKFSDSIEVHRY
ncbi:uncharacterized protein LOC144432118 [Styela clava]